MTTLAVVARAVVFGHPTWRSVASSRLPEDRVVSAHPPNARATSGPLRAALALLALPVLLAACGAEVETAAPEPRPVRTVTVEKREAGTPVMLTGRIEAEDEVTLGFRIAGRVLENNLKLGDRLQP